MNHQSVGQASSRVSDLAEQVDAIASTVETEEHALRRYERQAEELIPSSPEEAHTALGILAALRWDVDGLDRHHGMALHHAPDTAVARCSYSRCLLQIGEVEAAFRIGREAFEQAPGDARVLRHLIGVAVEAGYFRYARDLCWHWRDVFPEEEVPCERAVADVVAALERDAFPERDARTALRIAHAERGAAKLRMTRSVVRRDCVEADGFLHTIHVLASNDFAVDFNERIIEKILDCRELRPGAQLKYLPMSIGMIVNDGDEQGSA